MYKSPSKTISKPLKCDLPICKPRYKTGRIDLWFFIIFRYNGIFLYTSPVNRTGRPSFAAFIASNFPSTLPLILCADQREEAPFKLKAMKELGSSKKIISHVHKKYIWMPCRYYSDIKALYWVWLHKLICIYKQKGILPDSI